MCSDPDNGDLSNLILAIRSADNFEESRKICERLYSVYRALSSGSSPKSVLGHSITDCVSVISFQKALTRLLAFTAQKFGEPSFKFCMSLFYKWFYLGFEVCDFDWLYELDSILCTELGSLGNGYFHPILRYFVHYDDSAHEQQAFKIHCLSRHNLYQWRDFISFGLQPHIILLLLLTKIVVWIWKYLSDWGFQFLSNALSVVSIFLYSAELTLVQYNGADV